MLWLDLSLCSGRSDRFSVPKNLPFNTGNSVRSEMVFSARPIGWAGRR